MREEETGEPFQVPCCATCHGQVTDKDGVPLTDAELRRRNGEDAAARTNIEYPFAASDLLRQQAQAEPGGLMLSGAERQAGHKIDDKFVRIRLMRLVRRTDDDRRRTGDADNIEVVVPGGAPVAIRKSFDTEQGLGTEQIGCRVSRRRLELMPLLRGKIGGDFSAFGAVVVPRPGFFGRLFEQVLNARVVYARQLPGGDGEFGLRPIHSDRGSDQCRRAANC